MGSLFGSLDFCECEDCRSVLGPAAYFVDILQFIYRGKAEWHQFLETWKSNHFGASYPYRDRAQMQEHEKQSRDRKRKKGPSNRKGSGGALGAAEQSAASKATVHANTPTAAHFDALGRQILTVVYNRFIQSGSPVEARYSTGITVDIQGNQLSVIDALGRKMATYECDLLKNRLHRASSDAGDRWTLNDLSCKPLLGWNGRGFKLRYVYDALRRPTQLYVQPRASAEILVESTVYGELPAAPEVANLRGKIYQHYDGTGVATNTSFDFKGNLTAGSRQLALQYQEPVDWSSLAALKDPGKIASAAAPLLQEEILMSSSTFDALNRIITATAPDGSVQRPVFNEANLLEQMSVNLLGAAAATTFVTNIDYNAKGQRTLIQYGNGAQTTYNYDPETFRLTELKTTRTSDKASLQDLSYAYDPAGNITSIGDAAQQTIYFSNQVVTANNDYTYNALYRLISTSGREHIGQLSRPHTDWDDAPRMNQPLPTDGQAMRNYVENYSYDAVGNLLSVVHQATNGNWTRTYAYDEPNPSPANNRLTSTAVGALKDPYSYDANGNMTPMPHLPQMRWDFKDQLASTQRQVVNNAPGETTYYVYDASGQRVRKVTQSGGGTKRKERIYLGGCEIYREYASDGSTVTLERQTLHAMDDKQRIALVETRTKGDDGSPVQLVRYQLATHLGSAILELDAKAQTLSYEEYFPYGSTSFQTVRGEIDVAPKRYRFTGKERDHENDLYFHGARYYATWLGRWISADRDSSFQEGVFTYAKDNPILLFDPNGQADRPGFWHFQAEYWKGVGAGAGELATGLGNAAAHPLDTARAMGNAAEQAYKQDGLPGAVNQFNPAYHAMVAGYEYYQAASQGNPREAGRQAFRAVSNTAGAVLLATGVGGLAGGGLAGAAEATTISVRVPTVLTAATEEGALPVGLGSRVVTIPVPAAVSTVAPAAPALATAGAGVLMMAGNGQGGPPQGSGSGGGSGSPNGSPSQGKGKGGSGKPGGGSGGATAAARPSLLQQAVAAGAREEIEGQVEVFPHGTTARIADELVETQGGSLSASGGNFAGKFHTVPDLDVADVFAARTAAKVAGEQPAVVGVALPKAVADRLRSLGQLTREAISNPPPGVSPSTTQWVFKPGALQTLKDQGFFFRAQ